jgi:hypothetical protein
VRAENFTFRAVRQAGTGGKPSERKTMPAKEKGSGLVPLPFIRRPRSGERN